jgi:hypothetical protein
MLASPQACNSVPGTPGRLETTVNDGSNGQELMSAQQNGAPFWKQVNYYRYLRTDYYFEPAGSIITG